MNYREVVPADYCLALHIAMLGRAEIREALAPGSEKPARWAEHARFYLAADGHSGFAVVGTELRGAFSAARGRGDSIMVAAVAAGANMLDHFDVGTLSALYERHGFREVDRAANWTPGGPDVIYRERTV